LIITCLRRSLYSFDCSNLQSLPINIQLSKTSKNTSSNCKFDEAKFRNSNFEFRN
jgi:hypothetical protein